MSDLFALKIQCSLVPQLWEKELTISSPVKLTEKMRRATGIDIDTLLDTIVNKKLRCRKETVRLLCGPVLAESIK